jgi:uncharacterized protein with PIN domain
MLGSLAKKLRLLGIDTSYSNNTDHSELRYIVRSQGRTLLTRDVKLAKSLGVSAWLVTGSNAREEFISISGRLGPFRDQIKPFSKCLDCNKQLQPIEPSDAHGMVPPYIYQVKKTFFRCSSCGKIFWEGTHKAGMEGDVEWMREILEEEKRGRREKEK